jgi:hypothetical protein
LAQFDETPIQLVPAIGLAHKLWQRLPDTVFTEYTEALPLAPPEIENVAGVDPLESVMV